MYVAGVGVDEFFAVDGLDDDLVLDLVDGFPLALDEVEDLGDALAVALHLDAVVHVVDDGRHPLAAVAHERVLAHVDPQQVEIVRRRQHRYQKLFLRNQLYTVTPKVTPLNGDFRYFNPLECKGNYCATSSNMKYEVGTLAEERPGRAGAPPSPLLAVPNITAHPSTASVPTLYYLMWHYDCLWDLKG